jgi:DNA-binding response OmpR family regulator
MLNILVVDDDADLAEMVTILLTRSGMCVHNLSSGNGLTETIISFRPDIILMDIYLGDHDGRELCRSLKTGDYKSIPVILYSAGHITVASVKASMADAFIAKPFELDVLLDKIDEFVN